jgi:2-polyprenyl-3-methyl-5-hydroxy-6-metoxy-1,4-benzoquinol methylase
MEKQEYQVMYELENTYWWYVVLHELVESIVKQELHNNQKLQILDAGCGTGKMMEILSSFTEVHGLDYAEQAIDFCKKRGLENVVVANLNTWPPPQAMYDSIISLDVLYHAAIDDDNAVLEKFYKALKPDGVLILNLPAFNILRREHDAVVFNKRRYRKKQLAEQVRKAGFTVEFISYRLPHMFFLILIRK